MAAENARIGVAKAAFFPSLSLTGSLGYESADLGNLTQWSQRTFLLGPLIGTALRLPSSMAEGARPTLPAPAASTKKKWPSIGRRFCKPSAR